MGFDQVEFRVESSLRSSIPLVLENPGAICQFGGKSVRNSMKRSNTHALVILANLLFYKDIVFSLYIIFVGKGVVLLINQ